MSTFRSRSLGQTVSEMVDFFFNLLFMFPRELHYILEEGMSDKHNNKVAKEIENSKGWMQVIVQKQTPERLTNRTDRNIIFRFLCLSNCHYFRCRNF